MKRTIAARSIGRGLAKVEPNSPNTMIAFAAKAGSTASDGDSKKAAPIDHPKVDDRSLPRRDRLRADSDLLAPNCLQKIF
jgi:hypothetical protein